MTVVFLVCPADAFAAHTMTTAYGMPVVDLIQIPDIRPQRLDQGRAFGILINGHVIVVRNWTYPVAGYLTRPLEYMQ